MSLGPGRDGGHQPPEQHAKEPGVGVHRGLNTAFTLHDARRVEGQGAGIGRPPRVLLLGPVDEPLAGCPGAACARIAGWILTLTLNPERGCIATPARILTLTLRFSACTAPPWAGLHTLVFLIL